MDDALSEIFKRIRLKGCVYFQRDFFAPWSMDIRDTGAAQFHVITRGHCVIIVDGVCHSLSAGDVVLFPRGDAHVLADAEGREPIPGKAAMESFGGDAPMFSAGEHATRLICGHYEYHDVLRHPVIDELPPFVHVPSLDPGTNGAVQSLLSILMEEMAAERPGMSSVVERLAEVLLVQVIRAYFSAQHRHEPQSRGFYAGLQDRRLAKAFAKIHSDSDENLTLTDLAREAGMSRSGFAQHFRDIVGLSPIEYHAKWRLFTAAHFLETGEMKLARIAERVGYESDSAFSRAFKREFAVSPSEYRRRAMGTA